MDGPFVVIRVYFSGRIYHMALLERARETTLQREDFFEPHFLRHETIKFDFLQNWNKIAVLSVKIINCQGPAFCKSSLTYLLTSLLK